MVNIEVPDARLRARRIDERSLIAGALAEAASTGRPCVRAAHGGSVAKAYKHPAETEGALVVALPNGRAWGRVLRFPAKGSGLVTAARRCSPPGADAAPLFEARATEARRRAAETAVVRAVAAHLLFGHWAFGELSAHQRMAVERALLPRVPPEAPSLIADNAAVRIP